MSKASKTRTREAAAAAAAVAPRMCALAKNLPISAQKGRLAADLVRGLPVAEAVERLQFSRQKAAGLLKKVLDSAIANAEENHHANIDELFVSRVEVSQGSRFNMMRVRFGARGRVGRIVRSRSHFLLELAPSRSGARGSAGARG